MKLSTLIHYRTLLRKATPVDMTTVIRDQAGHALHLVQEHELQFPDLTQNLSYDYHNIYQAFSDFTDTIGNIQREIRALINELEPAYFEESMQLYQEELDGDQKLFAQTVLSRNLNISEDATAYLNARIKFHGDWRHAGLIIRPAQDPWIESLVACDPLYLVDQNHELLLPALSKFTEQYANRVRTYSVHESFDSPMLDLLPDEQFGFCLIYNFLNYKPLDLVKAYLSEIYKKLKPGGTVAFTFNNCDHSGAVILAERKFMCYTPGSLVMAFCESLGYDIIQTYQIDAACTWVELKKDGMLTSLRGGQSLARIVAKSK